MPLPLPPFPVVPDVPQKSSRAKTPKLATAKDKDKSPSTEITFAKSGLWAENLLDLSPGIALEKALR